MTERELIIELLALLEQTDHECREFPCAEPADGYQGCRGCQAVKEATELREGRERDRA